MSLLVSRSFIDVCVIYSVVFAFCCTQGDPLNARVPILPHILFPCGLSQDIDYGSLRCPVGPCCLGVAAVLFNNLGAETVFKASTEVEGQWQDEGDRAQGGFLLLEAELWVTRCSCSVDSRPQGAVRG